MSDLTILRGLLKDGPLMGIVSEVQSGIAWISTKKGLVRFPVIGIVAGDVVSVTEGVVLKVMASSEAPTYYV